MRRPLVAGNWKMNGSRAMATELAQAVVRAAPAGSDTLVCPPAPYLSVVAEAVRGSNVAVGGQDCSEYAEGAYTGEVAAPMLRDNGCSHVIIGHSERRQFFADSDARVAAKVAMAHRFGLVPLLCVGESLAERRAEATEAVIGRQLESVLQLANAKTILQELVIAYEPVWAIGTGESATPDQAQDTHAWIRARVAAFDADCAARVRIVYGGSVKPENAADLFSMPDIDGGLIGGASLTAESFVAICCVAA